MNTLNSDINECYRIAREELHKITCYDIPADVQRNDVCHYYVNEDIYEESIGDRGAVYKNKIGTKHDLISALIYRQIRDFAFDHELHHRRKFEDNRRQVNEIIIRCYGYLDDKYEYRLMSNIRDNANISFDLLRHYIDVCKKLIGKNTIPEDTVSRIRFIADKEYAGSMGGMHDVAFALDYVRYNISEIIKVLPVTQEEFMQHEDQYLRLVELEKEHQNQPGKYPLGSWDSEVFREAEAMLKGKRLTDGEALKCALYMLINLVHHDKAVGISLDLCFHKDIDIKKYRPVLDEIFISDKYGMYHFGPARNFDQERKSRLTYKLLCGDTAERKP